MKPYNIKILPPCPSFTLIKNNHIYINYRGASQLYNIIVLYREAKPASLEVPPIFNIL